MEIIPYTRVGTTFYKLVRISTISGHLNEQLAKELYQKWLEVKGKK
ncbi:MAG: hypothetical protein ACX93O_12575 [Flagellimonas sp.]